jgi:hypothetical protein
LPHPPFRQGDLDITNAHHQPIIVGASSSGSSATIIDGHRLKHLRAAASDVRVLAGH